MENNIQVYIASGIHEALVGFELNRWYIRIVHERPVEQDKEIEIESRF